MSTAAQLTYQNTVISEVKKSYHQVNDIQYAYKQQNNIGYSEFQSITLKL